MALVRRLLGAAAACTAVAAVPSGVSVGASFTDQTESSTGVLCSGALNLEITAVDGRSLTPAKRADLAYGPTPSTFSLSHRLTISNDGTASLRGLALVTRPGSQDNPALARMLRVRVRVSVDGVATSTDTGDISLPALEKPASRPIPLPTSVGKSHAFQIQITFSATGLDNSVAGTSVSPTMDFVGSG